MYLNINKLSNVSITEPHSPLVAKSRGKFRKQLIIKLSNDKIPTSLKRELKKINSSWLIDVDPISI